MTVDPHTRESALTIIANVQRDVSDRLVGFFQQLGEFSFWIEGGSIAIGYCQTSISAPCEIRLAVPVNVWARARDDVTQLAAANSGDPVEVRLK